MINYDSHRGVRVQNDRLGSTLTLSGASAADSGNYTCTPDSVRASSVSVHVVTEGEGEGAAGRAQEAVASDNNKGGGGKDKVGSYPKIFKAKLIFPWKISRKHTFCNISNSTISCS